MEARRSGWWAVTLAIVVGGCAPRALEPTAGSTGSSSDSSTGSSTGGSPNPGDIIVRPPPDLVTSLRLLNHAYTKMVLGTNAGAVVARDGITTIFEDDADALAEAAATVGMSVRSVELRRIVTPSTPGDPEALTIAAALDEYDSVDLADMVARLNALKTASTVVIIAANTAVTVRSTNNGINFFYDDDIIRLLRAARQLYVAACIVIPDSLAVPTYPTGQTSGLSIDAALARCGRL